MTSNIEAEQNVLGAMLCSTSAVDRVIDRLQPEHFYFETHGELFRLLREMHEAGLPLDATSVVAYVNEHGGLERVGGSVRVHELIGLVPSTSNVVHHAKLVRDAYTKRLIDTELVALRNELETLPADEALARFEQGALEVAAKVEERHDTIVEIAEAIASFRSKLDKPLDERAGIQVPFKFIDPMQPARLYILGGYQGDGKTTTAMQFAAAAAQGGAKVGILSLEMSYHDLFDRWVAQQTGVRYSALRTGNLLPSESDTVHVALQEMAEWKVTIVDDERITAASIRKYQRLGHYDVLIIDHLHRMAFADRREIENAVKAVTNVAREFEIPVLLLAQLSRAGDWTKPFPVPTQRSLRESGMIEAEAAHIWFVYRERDEDGQRKDTGRFVVAKNRFGSEGTYWLRYNKETVSFRERQEIEPPEEVPQVVAAPSEIDL